MKESKSGMVTLNFRVSNEMKRIIWKRAEILNQEAMQKFGNMINFTPSDLIRKILEDWSKKN